MENQPIKILAIDDNLDNLITIQALVSESFPKAMILKAINGKDALKLAEKENPDVILLDVIMPEMDGFEVCERLKSNPNLANIPVVFVTALKGDRESRIKALEAGAEAFLAKPIDQSELVAEIRAMMKIRTAYLYKQKENSNLLTLVEFQTRELRTTHTATLNLMEDLRAENEARRVTEDALKASEALYRSILDASPDNITVSDLEGRIKMISPNGLKLIGYKEEEIIGRYLGEFLIPEDTERAIRNIEGMFNGVFNGSEEYKLIHADKSIIPVEINAEFVRDDAGEPIQIVFAIRDITERIRNQKAIRDSEEKFRFMAENTSDVLWHADMNFRFDYVSLAIERIQGYKPHELIGKEIFSLLNEDGNRQIQEINTRIKQKLERGKLPKGMQFEYETICKDGSWLWVEVNVSIQFDDEMKPSGFYGVTRDISDRKKDEIALRESEEKYRMLVENSPNGIAMYQDGKFVYINSTGLKLFGTDNPDQILGKSVLSIVHADSMEAVIQRVSQVASGSQVPPLEEKLIRFDGSIFYAEVTALSTTFNGQPAGQVIVNNITDRKLADEKLSDSEEKFREMANLLPQIIFELDLDGTVTYVNQQTETVFGYQMNDLLGKNSTMLHIPEERDRVVEGIRNKLAGINTVNNEYKMVRKDGSIFPALIYTSVVINKNLPVGIRGVLVDISAQKLAEQSIRHIAKLYALQSHINQAIVTSKNEQELFETICDVSIKYGQFKMSWIGIYDKEQDKLKPAYHAGFNEGYLEALKIVPGNRITGKGPTGIAYHESRMVFCNDIATDEMMIPWREEALKRDYKSSFATPVLRKRKQYATFTLYATEKDFFQEDEQKLLSDIGENISFALDAFDSENDRKTAEIALIESELKYRSLMDNSPEGITIYVDGRVAYINKEALRLMRANDKSELMGKTIVDFIHPDNIELVIERMKLVAMAPVNSILPSVEEKYIRLDGTEVFVEIKVMPILFEGKPAIQLAGHDITDRKQAELALEQSRIELQTIYDSAPVMMCVVDEERQIQFANQAFTSLTGVHEDIIKGGAIGRVVGCINSMDDTRGCGYGPKCGTCTLRMAMQKTFLTGVGQTNVEYKSTLEIGGILRNVSLLGSTALIKNDDSKRLLMCLIDITDRKLTEEALQKSETLLRTFIDNSPFEIWARDNDNIGILENKKLTEHYGSIIGYSTTNDPRVDKDVIELWERNNARVFAGEIIDEEYEFDVNGSPRQFQQIVFPIKNNEKVVGIAGFNIDITDRKNAEQKIVESNNRFELAAQIANMSWWEMNLKSSEVIFSRNKTDLLGYEASQFTTYHDFQKIVHPDDIENCNLTMINHILNKVEKYEVEFRMLTSTGEYRWFYDIGSISKHDLNGEPLSISGLSIDITERKKSIEALNESKEELAKFASHLQSVREEERSILARDIHDDLGQILIAMKIDLGLLKQNVMKNMNTDEYETLRMRFEELSKLVDNTLKSARRIMTDLRPEVLDLLGFVETVTQHLKSFEERTKISCIFSNNVENLNLNSKQSVALYRIVQEALNNTAKYSRATEVQLNLKEEGNYLSLVISDNGVGFDMNDPKRGDSYGLMGMKERAVLLEGKLEISSNKGNGTRIKVLLPHKPENNPQL